MGWTEIAEITKTVAPMFTALAACAGAVIGWRGLEKWRSETWGKRQAEIAETTLEHVYEMEEILREARNSWVMPHEMTTREGVPNEVATNGNYAPEARLLKHEGFFARFRAKKFAFAAIFGRDAAKPLEELWRVRLDINWAVSGMLQNKELQFGNAEESALWSKWYYTAFRSADPENDALGERILVQVAAIETTCRPAIEARAKT